MNNNIKYLHTSIVTVLRLG